MHYILHTYEYKECFFIVNELFMFNRRDCQGTQFNKHTLPITRAGLVRLGGANCKLGQITKKT